MSAPAAAERHIDPAPQERVLLQNASARENAAQSPSAVNRTAMLLMQYRWSVGVG